jgi:IS5 family transposase
MQMKHRMRPPEQDDLLRPRLVNLIDQRHQLVNWTTPID